MNERTAEYKAYIEGFLKDWYARFHDEPQSKLFDAMEYSLLMRVHRSYIVNLKAIRSYMRGRIYLQIL